MTTPGRPLRPIPLLIVLALSLLSAAVMSESRAGVETPPAAASGVEKPAPHGRVEEPDLALEADPTCADPGQAEATAYGAEIIFLGGCAWSYTACGGWTGAGCCSPEYYREKRWCTSYCCNPGGCLTSGGYWEYRCLSAAPFTC